MPEARSVSPTKKSKSLLGWAVSLLCLALIAWKVDVSSAIAALNHFSWPFALLSLAGLGFGYAIRIVRWAVMLNATGASVRPVACAAPFLGSIALNNVLPFRAGDVIRATVFPAAIGVGRSAAIGSIIMERLLDLLTLVLFLAVGASVLRGPSLPSWLVDGAILLSVIGVAALAIILLVSAPLARVLSRKAEALFPSKLSTKVLRALIRLLESCAHMSMPRVLAKVIALSALVWLGEALAYYAVMLGFGFELPALSALLVMSFVTLSTLVPSSPGYVGTFHLAAISVMVLMGTTEDVATSFAILCHLMLWLPTTLAGGIATLIRPEIFQAAKQS